MMRVLPKLATRAKVPNNDGCFETHVVHLAGHDVASAFLQIQACDIVPVANHKSLLSGVRVSFDYVGADGVHEVLSAWVCLESMGDFSCKKKP